MMLNAELETDLLECRKAETTIVENWLKTRLISFNLTPNVFDDEQLSLLVLYI